jgi:hypothetical protein
MRLESSRQISKKFQISSFIKILPMGAELFHADGQTDMIKLLVAFYNFAKAPNENRNSRMCKVSKFPKCVAICLKKSLTSVYYRHKSALTSLWLFSGHCFDF